MSQDTPPRDRFDDLKGPFTCRRVDDGDPHVYIKTDWFSIVCLVVFCISLWYWMGRP